MVEVQWVNLRAPDIRELQNRNAITIVPIGSIEQHGPHLPVQVDALLVSEIARRAAIRLIQIEPVVVAPTIWSGLAEHHMSLGGTLTLDLRTFAALLRCIVHSLVRSGFRRIILLNGHGGNITALNALVGELTSEINFPIAFATYWLLAREEFSKILEHQPNVCHACEAETSMVLAVRPDLVDMTKLEGINAPHEWKGDSEDIYLWRSVESWSPSGVAGAPNYATAEKGERLLEAATAVLARHLGSGGIWPEQ